MHCKTSCLTLTSVRTDLHPTMVKETTVDASLLDTIKQLWLTDLLPDDRRLKPLAKVMS